MQRELVTKIVAIVKKKIRKNLSVLVSFLTIRSETSPQTKKNYPKKTKSKGSAFSTGAVCPQYSKNKILIKSGYMYAHIHTLTNTHA